MTKPSKDLFSTTIRQNLGKHGRGQQEQKENWETVAEGNEAIFRPLPISPSWKEILLVWEPFFFFKRRRRETNLYVVLLASTLSNLILTATGGGNGVEEKEAALRGAY